ncbi:polysaccharide deacetylase family protein [bacterium]|nr:polysaccharide deacetylase family protein [bacterium]
MSSHHVILCCDCEGTREQIERIRGAIDGAGVPANWFFVGETTRAFPDLIRSISESHQVESHTDTHPNLRKLRKERQRIEIMAARRAVEDVIGRPTRGFRAPMHCFNRNTVEILHEEGFAFDASRLYFRLNMGELEELHPTWFREWMPLYEMIHLRPKTAFRLFRLFTRVRTLSVLPVHPHYAGKSDELAAAFRWFLDDALARGVRFWSIDRWLAVKRDVPPPEWMSPLEEPLKSKRTRR